MSNNTIKLSNRQREAIDYMKIGYELGNGEGFFTSTWLQLGGCGRGGKIYKISSATFFSLLKRGLIKQKMGQWPYSRPKRYQLTELGKTI